jgi:hypothetical protein
MEQYADCFKGFTEANVGWSQRRRIVGPRHEVMLLVPLPRSARHGFVADGPTLLEDTRSLLMMYVDDFAGTGHHGYLFAGLGRQPPSPGWPPSFWEDGDPVALAVHPGAQRTSEAQYLYD